jgi:hypothetical protein
MTDADLNIVLFKFVLPKDANDKDVIVQRYGGRFEAR